MKPHVNHVRATPLGVPSRNLGAATDLGRGMEGGQQLIVMMWAVQLSNQTKQGFRAMKFGPPFAHGPFDHDF